MIKKASFSVTSHLDKVKEIIEWILTNLGDVHLFPQEKRKIELAMEEAIVNIILHSYERKGGEVEITLNTDKPGEIKLSIQDSGPPFDPLAHTEMIQAKNLVGAQGQGGLGVLLMCRAMDHVHYQRAAHRNILTFTKKLRSHTKTN